MPIRYASKRNADAEFQRKNNREATKAKKGDDEAADEMDLTSDAPAISPNVFYFLLFVLFGRCVFILICTLVRRGETLGNEYICP